MSKLSSNLSFRPQALQKKQGTGPADKFRTNHAQIQPAAREERGNVTCMHVHVTYIRYTLSSLACCESWSSDVLHLVDQRALKQVGRWG